jgi:hypothetical protein
MKPFHKVFGRFFTGLLFDGKQNPILNCVLAQVYFLEGANLCYFIVAGRWHYALYSLNCQV